ncbi:hypothetical protein OBJ92_09045 [Empedobacter falsenii]
MKLIIGFLLFLFISCKNNSKEINSILIYKLEQLSIVNDSLQKELDYANANLEACKSVFLKEDELTDSSYLSQIQ